MKRRRGILLTILTLVVASILGTTNSVQATTAVNSKTLNIKAVRSSGWGYKVVNNATKYIWKIYNTRNDINETFYCIKGGPGFGGESMDSAIDEAEYTEVFDMRKPNTITSTYRTALALIYGTKDYERLMWVLDQCYIPAKNNASSEDRKTAEDSKITLLNAVEEYANKYPLVYENTSDYNNRLVDNLTDDDIDAIQQLAVWYYTNDDVYHVENNPNIYLGFQDNTYAALNSNDDEDNARIHAMNALFDYLTKTPKEAGFSYDYETDGDTSSPVEIKQTNPVVTTEGNRHIVGPYTINQLRNIKYDIEATFTDGSGTTITDVKFLDSSKTEVADSTIKDMIGTNKVFYISIPATTNATNIRMSISGKYFDTTVNYWSVANPDPRRDQPVVQVEKGSHPITGYIEAEKEPELDFDLALRKFITNIRSADGTASRVPENRVPAINDITKQVSDITIEKTHDKTPQIVNTGDIVTYNIRIYNEGEVAGWATEVKDYLPEGLEFIPTTESAINQKYGWSVSADGKTVSTTYLAGTNKKLDAYVENGTTSEGGEVGEVKKYRGLSYIDLQIECRVKATVSNNNKTLKNIAEITGNKDENGNTDLDLDRDSRPGNVTTSTDTYNPKDPTKGLGEEDDDDYEDLILIGKKFDLALRKFITSINGNTLTGADSRVPTISNTELQKLANKQATKDDGTTAEKNHRKDALKVETGDKVIYTIRIYNEGEIAGFATKVTDYLPEGLKFLTAAESTTNDTYGWTNPSGDGKTIETTFLADHKLDAFDGTNLDLDYADLQIECEVIATPGDTTKSMKNVAAITGHKDENGNTGTNLKDRDSQPEDLSADQVNNYGDEANYYQDDDDFEHLIMEPTIPKRFDLALRKFITSINGTPLTEEDSRVPTITPEELQRLKDKQATGINNTSAKKEHRKDPLTVQTGNRVVYTIRVYNEGEVAGWATQITDHLPSGLRFIPAAESTVNNTYRWTVSEDGRTVTTDYLAAEGKKINAFNGTELDYEDVQIECEVVAVAGASTKTLKNIAEITGNKDIEGNTNRDLDDDSTPGSLTDDQIQNYGTTSKEDDDDFEDLKLLPKEEKIFDLSLRKFISDVTTDGKSHVLASREPEVITDPLLEGEDTAIYNHTKKPVGVSNNDIVTYTIRVYNEGQVDGYITKITDHLPPQLEFLVDDELNKQYGWETVPGSNGRTIETDITSPKTTKTANQALIYADRVAGNDKVLLKAFSYTEGDTLDYIDVQIRCKVKENINLYQKITNIAEITDCTDSEGNEVVDRKGTESKKDNVVLPTDETLPGYKDPEIESGKTYIPGQEDDDDFEKLELRIFDLALRKFITGVTNGETTTDITNRAPVFVKNGTEYSYEHTKEPVEVANGNVVIYTLRIFNEGNVAGYASKVKDDLPDGLEFLPEHSINTAFQWNMYKEDGTETKDVSEAKYIETDFLSKEKEKVEKENLIAAFNPQIMDMPDYRDVKIAFKVTEPNTSDRIIINQAQISDDSDEEGKPVDDVDSKPDEWNEGEDDQDIEKIKVKYFDLSLKKWVTESIVTLNGKTTVTKSGHTGNENPEPPMKVEIPYGKTNTIVVKFRFNIKVTNEGEIAGYAKELEDYIPEGLKFVAKDNPKWTEKDGRVTTDQLKDTLLQPGESATVNIVLTWINGKNNMGQKVNWAEISKDENEYNSPDIDSTPGNKVKGEDDIDQAPVLLAPATGSSQTYAILVLGCTSILAGGIFLIKKYVI